MKRITWPLLMVFLIFQSCSQKPWLSGQIDTSETTEWKPMVYLVKPAQYKDVAQSFVGAVLDSARIEPDGSFKFSKPLEQDGLNLLQIVVQKKGEKYPNRLTNENPETDNYFPVLVSSEHPITIQATIEKFQSTFTIDGPSKTNRDLLKLRDVKKRAYQTYLKSLDKDNSSDEQLLDREKRALEYQLQLMQFADSSQELLPALIAIKWASPDGDFERLPEALFYQAQKWETIAPDHPWTKELSSMANKEQLPIMIGDTVPNLVVPLKNGDTINLYEVLEDKKLVLLDVWASWCAPCRMENRNVLVPLWEKYHTDEFEILAYGLESSEVAWDKAIQRDGAYRWLHGSHLQGDQNPFMESLHLRTIPANFLLDNKGKVLAKNLHGEGLNRFVDNYMEPK